MRDSILINEASIEAARLPDNWDTDEAINSKTLDSDNPPPLESEFADTKGITFDSPEIARGSSLSAVLVNKVKGRFRSHDPNPLQKGK